MVTWQNGHYHIDRLTRFRMQTGAPPLTSEHKAFLFEKWRLLEYPYSSTEGVWLFERCLVAGGQLHNICVCMCVRVQQQTGQYCGLKNFESNLSMPSTTNNKRWYPRKEYMRQTCF